MPAHLLEIISGFCRQRAPLLQVARPPVIGGQGLGDATVIPVQHFPEIPGAPVNVFPGIIGLAHAQVSGRPRHQLHKAHGAFRGGGPGIEVALHFNHRPDKVHRHLVALGRLADQAVISGGIGPSGRSRPSGVEETLGFRGGVNP